MRYAIGSKVQIADPYLKGLWYEIFGYDSGMYKLWDKVGRISVEVSEEEILDNE